MLFLFRKSQKYLLWILLVVVVITFVGFYGNSNLPQRKKILVATFNGEDIYQEDVAYAARGVIIYLKLMQVETIPNDLEMEGLQMLVNIDQAKKAGYVVSDEELESSIQNLIPQQALSSIESYQRMVAQITGMSIEPREFEEHIRNIILIEKGRQYLTETVLVTAAEEKLQYQIDNTLAKVSYVTFEYKDFMKGITASSNEVEEFFNTSPKDFTLPESVDFIAAIITPTPNKVVVSDDQIDDYYEIHKDYYIDTNAVEATETVFLPKSKVKKLIIADLKDQISKDKASDQVDMLEFALMDSVLEPQAQIEAFVKKAKSLDIQLIEPGLVNANANLPFLKNSTEAMQTAFSLNIGQMSPTLKIDDNSSLIMIVRDKKEAYIPELNQCYDEVQTIVIKRRAAEKANEVAKALESKLRDNPDGFVAGAKKLGYKAKTTDPLNRTEQIKGVQCPPGLVSYLFAFPEQYPIVLPCMNGLMVASLTKIIPADEDLMDKEDNQIGQQLFYKESGLMMQMLAREAQSGISIKKIPTVPTDDL